MDTQPTLDLPDFQGAQTAFSGPAGCAPSSKTWERTGVPHLVRNRKSGSIYHRTWNRGIEKWRSLRTRDLGVALSNVAHLHPRLAALHAASAICEGLPHSKMGYVYMMKSNLHRFTKIGFSRKPEKREKTLQAEDPELSMIFNTKAPSEYERFLHLEFAGKRRRGEWFDLDDGDVSLVRSGELFANWTAQFPAEIVASIHRAITASATNRGHNAELSREARVAKGVRNERT